MKKRIGALITVSLVSTLVFAAGLRREHWSAKQIEEIRKLSISELEPLPPDATNRVADDARAIELGHKLFFDTRLSSNGKVSCASCHKPEREFQDGTPLAVGVETTARRTMPIAGTAYSPFLFWDGRKDSQWSQALGPLESAVEHGGTRAQYAHLIATSYRSEYEQVFGTLPDVAVRPVRRPADRLRESARERTQRRRGGRPSTVHWQSELHAMPQRSAIHQQ